VDLVEALRGMNFPPDSVPQFRPGRNQKSFAGSNPAAMAGWV